MYGWDVKLRSSQCSTHVIKTWTLKILTLAEEDICEGQQQTRAKHAQTPKTECGCPRAGKSKTVTYAKTMHMKKIYAYPPWHEKNAKGRKKNIKFRLSKFKSDVMILNITSISNPQSGWQVVWAHAGPTTQIISNINFELFFKEIFFFQMNYIYQKITFIIQNILNLFLNDKNVFNILKTNRA